MKNDSFIGRKFSSLEVLEFCGYSETTKRKTKLYKCRCDCGNYTIANAHNLSRGYKKSCGCLRGKNTFVDLTGEKFGMLTVLNRSENKNNSHVLYNCLCECGNTKIADAYNLKNGITKSCGCVSDMPRHDLNNTRLSKIWRNMKQRCYNPKSIGYKYYGAKGVSVCDEWKNDFMNFYNWAIKNGYSDNLTIDRINPFGNYEPKNCRWATYKEQANNKRKNYVQN